MDYFYIGDGYVKSINDGIGNILFFAALYEGWKNALTGIVFLSQFFYLLSLIDQVLGYSSPFFCQRLFIRLRIVDVLVVGDALTITNHPDFLSLMGEYDGTRCQSFHRMIFESSYFYATVPISLLDRLSNLLAEFYAADIGIHCLDECRYQLHAIPSIVDSRHDLPRGLAGTSIDNGNKVICHDDSVFACFLTVFANYFFLDDLHAVSEGMS